MRSYNYLLKFNTFFFKGIYDFLHLVIIRCVRHFLHFLSFRLYKLHSFQNRNGLSFFLRPFYFYNNGFCVLKHRSLSSLFCSVRRLFYFIFFYFFFVNTIRLHLCLKPQRLMSSFVCDILSHNIPFVFININLAGRIFFSEYVHVSYIIFILKRSFYNHFLKFLGLPIKFKKFVFLKSPHVHKKAREHLEIRWHRLNVFFSVFFILFDFSKYISLYGGNFSLLINRIEHDFKIL